MYILFVWAAIVAAGPGTNTSWDWVAKAEFITQHSCVEAAKTLQFKNYYCIKK